MGTFLFFRRIGAGWWTAYGHAEKKRNVPFLLWLAFVLVIGMVPPMAGSAATGSETDSGVPGQTIEERDTTERGNVVEPKDPTIGRITALHKAVRSGNLEEARALIDQGADVNAAIARRSIRWHRLETPLETAIRQRHSEIAQLLVERGANVNARMSNGETLLHLATRLNDVALVRILLAGGAHPTLRSANGLGPAHLAQKLDRKSGKRKEIIALLKEAEAKELQEDPPTVLVAPPPGPLE